MNTKVSRSVTPATPWAFACPICREALEARSRDLSCPRCRRYFTCSSGIWRLLPEQRAQQYRQFLREYRTVREDQGWGRPDAAYFRGLPDVARDDPQWDIWRRRRRSYAVLVSRVIEPMSDRLQTPLRILDLGAGNCWLSHRLSLLGHRAAAVDISDDSLDGLGAHTWYGSPPEISFTPVQAEFDRLPFGSASAEVVLFNGSFHYSPDCAVTLREALSTLVSEGVVVILDSPVYHDAASGEAMVRERRSDFERRYGFRSSSIGAEQFLTWSRLAELAHLAGVHWHTLAPPARAGSQVREHVRQRWRAFRGLRELATMPVIVGYRTPAGERSVKP
jgi:SAM-dependent methyltransferase